ncbi:MAG: ferric reductase-like transmembrane domain-containing protein [Leptolyngbyaceae cyanobacterium]
MNGILLANLLGFLSLLCYVLTLLPTTLRVVFPAAKSAKILRLLLKHRRLVGVMSFYLALCHGFLIILKRNFDFFDVKTYGIYIQGVSTFLVFACLTITSNDWCMKKLKKNWKKLHQLTYLCMVLLTWHVWDKMSGHWSFFTPFSFIVLISIMVLFSARKWVESQNKSSQKNIPKQTPVAVER